MGKKEENDQSTNICLENKIDIWKMEFGETTRWALASNRYEAAVTARKRNAPSFGSVGKFIFGNHRELPEWGTR